MKNNTYIVKDIYQEKNKGRIYDMHKKKLEEINNQYPKLEDQKVMKKLKEKHNMIKTVSKFYNQEAFLEQQRVNQHLLLKIMQPMTSKTRSQHNQSRKEYAKINFDTKRISEENRNLANRITNLPPVIDAKKHDKEYRKHISDVVLMQKYHSNHLIEQNEGKTFQILNKLTNNKFNKSRYCNLNFLQQVNRNNKFIMFVLQEMNLFDSKHSSFSFMGRNPPTFQCSFYSDHKLIGQSKPLEYGEFLEQIIGFPCSEFTSIYFQIEKVKQNEEFEVGEVIYCESYSHININPLKDNIIIKVCDEIEGEIRKNISEQQVTVGMLKYKVLQICQKSSAHKLQVPPAAYAIQIKHSTPQPSVRGDPEEMPSQQLI